MYRVVLHTDGKEFLLHDARADDLQLIDPVLTLEVGKAGEFTFQIPATHPYYDQIKPLSSELFVYDEENLLFCGRPLNKEGDFYNTSSVTCEGELAYLLDSIQRPYTYQGNLPGFLRQAIQAHNSQVEARKQVTVGEITVMDTNNYINRSNSDYATTLDTLKEKLADTHGGYLRIRHVGDKRYLDYITDYGGTNDQTIRFGENLLDLTSHIQPEGVITALIPLGAETETIGINDTKKRLDVTSVNGGKDYIYNQEAVNTYGWIWGTQTWDDVTLPANLLRKAQAYLTECIALPVTIELNALDLGLVDVDVKKLELGYWTTAESVPHRISAPYLLSKASIHLTSPDQNTYVLGRTLPTFTGATAKQQKEISARIDQIGKSMNADIESAVENATELITGGKGGYILLDVEDEKGNRTMPWRILVLDSPDKNQAKNIIQINRNGIGFSTTGIDGPYKNAWTIDGHLVADFITTGELNGALLKMDSVSADKLKAASITADKLAAGAIYAESITGKNIQSGNAFMSFEHSSIFNGNVIVATGYAIAAAEYRIDTNQAKTRSTTPYSNGYEEGAGLNIVLRTHVQNRNKIGFVMDGIPYEISDNAPGGKCILINNALAAAFGAIQDLNGMVEELQNAIDF